MKLIRYNYPDMAPVAGMRRWLQDAFDAFDDFGPRLEPASRTGDNSVAADLYEGDDAFQAVLELPGFEKQDVKVSLENKVLTVKAERSEKDGENEQTYAVSRSVAVPDHISPDKVAAKLENGILTVNLPKAEEKKPKAIAVE